MKLRRLLAATLVTASLATQSISPAHAALDAIDEAPYLLDFSNLASTEIALDYALRAGQRSCALDRGAVDVLRHHSATEVHDDLLATLTTGNPTGVIAELPDTHIGNGLDALKKTPGYESVAERIASKYSTFVNKCGYTSTLGDALSSSGSSSSRHDVLGVLAIVGSIAALIGGVVAFGFHALGMNIAQITQGIQVPQLPSLPHPFR